MLLDIHASNSTLLTIALVVVIVVGLFIIFGKRL